MKPSLLVVATLLGVFVGPAFSGVLTLTSKGIQYMNNEQFAAMQDPYGQGAQQQGQQGLWRDDGSAGGQPGQGDPAQQAPPEYDDDENQSEQEQEDNDDEVEEQEEQEDNDEEEEERDIVDDEAPPAEVPVVEGKKSKYSVKVKTSKAAKPSLKETKKSKKVKVKQSEEVAEDEPEADDEEKPRPPPPMPDVLKHEMMNSDYDAQGNGAQHPGAGYPGAGYPGAGGYPGAPAANAPLLSRMTTYISSLLGRGGIGSDPIYMNRNAKSISEAENVETLSRTKRQVNLGDLQILPFYHVRNNIRTMVRRQPSTKLAPQPVDDFSNLSEKASKPIKLFMEPYSAPTTYQYPPIDPTQGVRGPSSSGNPGGLGSSSSSAGGLGQATTKEVRPSTSNSGGGKQQQGSSGGNKKNNNKQSNNKGKDKEGSSEEEDSDENNSEGDHQFPNYEEEEDESNNVVPTSEQEYEDGDDTAGSYDDGQVDAEGEEDYEDEYEGDEE